MPKCLKYAIVLILTAGLALGSLTASGGLYDAYKLTFGEARWQVKYNNFVDLVTGQLSSFANLITGSLPVENIPVMITATPTYVDGDTFTLPANELARFPAGAVVQARVAAGTVESIVASSSYAAPTTTVNLTSSVLTNPITRIYAVATRPGLWPNGPDYVVARDYGPDQAALEQADNLAVAAGKELLVTGAWTVATAHTFNAILTLQPGATLTLNDNVTFAAAVGARAGAAIAIATGKTLTIAGPLDAGDYQIFSWAGTGAIILTDIAEIKTAWFGDSAAGIAKAIAAAPIVSGGGVNNSLPRTVRMPGRAIALESTVTISNRKIALVGAGANRYDASPLGGTALTYLGAGPGIYLSGLTGVATTHIALRDFSISGNNTGEVGIQVGTDQYGIITYLDMDNVVVGGYAGGNKGFTVAGIDWRSAEYAQLNRVQSAYNLVGLKVGDGYSALIKFDTCSFGHNTQEGVLIDPGATVGSVFSDATFINCDMQGNGYEGLRAASSRSLSIKNLKLMSCWLEGNNVDAARAASGGYFDISLAGTAAQRIGNVTLIGNEWGSVQTRIGTDIVVNGGFGGDTDWTHDGSWTLGGTVATHTPGSVTVLEPSTPLTIEAGVSYLVSYTIGTRTAGFIKPVLGGRSGPTHSLNATYFDTIYTTTTGDLTLVPTAEFDGSIDNISVMKILNRALFATGVGRLVCLGNQWENADAFGTQCIFGAVGASEFNGVLSMDDPDKLWEWHNNTKVISKLHGDKYVGGAGSSTTGISSGVVLQNANIPKRSWTTCTADNTLPRYDVGGGSGNSVRIVAQGTKTGTSGAKVIVLTFGGRTVATLTSSTAAPWTIECDITHLYHSAGAGTFYYTTKMYDGNTVTHSNGTLGGGTAVNIYESVPIQVVGTSPTAGEVITASVLKYERE